MLFSKCHRRCIIMNNLKLSECSGKMIATFIMNSSIPFLIRILL